MASRTNAAATRMSEYIKAVMGLLLLGALAVGLCGCGEAPESLDDMVATEDDQLAREMIATFQAGDADSLLRRIDVASLGDAPKKAAANFRDALRITMRNIGDQECQFIELVGCNIVIDAPGSPGVRRADLTYQLTYPDSWYAVSILIESTEHKQKVLGFHFTSLPGPLSETNAFTFHGAGPMHYVMLALTIAVPLFMIFALVVCFRSKVRYKWLWIILILFGVGKFQFDWMAGELIRRATPGRLDIEFLFLGAGFANPTSGPLILTVSIPLAAILFLLLRRPLIKQAEVHAQKRADKKAGKESRPAVSEQPDGITVVMHEE